VLILKVKIAIKGLEMDIPRTVKKQPSSDIFGF